MTNIAIIGSRSFNDYDRVKNVLDIVISKLQDKDIIIVSGGAKGADTLGEKYADENGYVKIIIKPNWTKYGKIAGMLRNTEIIEKADLVVAFWDGKSPGTKDSINKAKKLNKKLIVVNI